MKIACPRCGADVAYDPATGKCHCDYCGSDADIKEFELGQYEREKEKAAAYEKQQATATQNGPQYNETQVNSDNQLGGEQTATQNFASQGNTSQQTYQSQFTNGTSTNSQEDIYDEFFCESCGAKLITDKTTTITRCVFCGSQQMIKQRMVGKFEPKEVIPFRITKDGFINIYTSFIRKMSLAPEEFRKNPGVSETRGLYVPFHLFKYDVVSYGRGKATRRDANGNGGNTWFELKVNDKVLVPVDGSVRLDDNIISSVEPYNLKESVPFNPAYITGFQAECTDETEVTLNDKAEKRVLFHTLKLIKSKIGQFNQVGGLVVTDMTMEGNASEYVLYPIWFLNTWYENKKYSYAVNGQTGKVVGEVPLSKPKFTSLMTILVIVALVLTILVLFLYYSSDSDSGIGKILVAIWGGIVVAPYVHIKKKYKNVSHISENDIPYKDRQIIKDTKYKREKDYKKDFPNDALDKVACQKYVNHKYVCSVNLSALQRDVSSIDKRNISINNKNL